MNRLPSYGYLTLLAALFVIGMNIWGIQSQRKKKNWPTVAGKIVEGSSIVRTTKASLRTPTSGTSGRSYYVEVPVWDLRVSYEYTVDGQWYGNTQATSNEHTDEISNYPNGPSPQMQEWKNQLPKGLTLPVHYDPVERNESYLIYTEDTSSFRGMFLTAFVLVAISASLIAAPRIFR